MSRALVLSFVPALFAANLNAAAVRGRTDKPVKEVVLLRRVEPTRAIADKHVPESHAAKLAPDGKSFSADNLPEGRCDLRIRLQDGSIIEGVDLGVKDVPAGAEKLSETDTAAIRNIVANLKTFFDGIRIFAIDGWRGRDDAGREGYAWVLVEQLRWRQTSYDRKAGTPFVVFRMDIWEFERMAGAWRKVKPFRVVYRMNVDVPEFEMFRWFFTRELSGVEIRGGDVDVGEIKIPQPDASTGRIGFPEKSPAAP